MTGISINARRVCACAVVIRHARVLLGHRSPSLAYYPDVWDLIGGHVKAEETPEQAMLREVEEEIGCHPTRYRFFETVKEPSQDGSASVELHIFVVTEWEGSEPCIKNKEHDDLGWFSLDEVKQLRLADRAYLDLFMRIDLLQ